LLDSEYLHRLGFEYRAPDAASTFREPSKIASRLETAP